MARRLESGGFDALVVGDHPGTGPSPWPALGAAAAVTTTLRLGTCVLQAGVRDPLQTAADAATLDVLAPGRVLLGVGAGHAFGEWEAMGDSRPSPQDRAGRLGEFVDALVRLLDGETVTIDGRYLRLHDARLDNLPNASRIALLIGGGNRHVLRLAAASADVVGLSGLGRTRPDGHRHEARWAAAELDAQLKLIREESSRSGTAPEIEALVQVVELTDDRPQALLDLAERMQGPTVADLDRTPYVLVGSVEQMAAQLIRQAEELGITRYVVREPALEAASWVLPLLGQR